MSPVAVNTVVDRKLEREKSHEPSGPRIRCPLGGWSPRNEDKWFCTCGNEWNTFDTGGVCPACLHQWTETQCLSCSRWSVKLKPGDSVGWHSTSANEEALVILHGSGVTNIEGHPDVPLTEKMLAYIPPATRHNVTNNGTQILEYVWVVAPTNEAAK